MPSDQRALPPMGATVGDDGFWSRRLRFLSWAAGGRGRRPGCTQQDLLQSGGDAPCKRRREGRLSQLLPEKSLSKAPVVTLRKEIESRPHERAAEMKDVVGRDLGAILKFALQTERKYAAEGLAVVAAPA